MRIVGEIAGDESQTAPNGERIVKLRKLLKITSRTSTITNSFVQAIIPSIEPSDAEVIEALEVLGMSRDAITCSYCGGTASDWDHLRPLVRGRRPTGYINEIRNLVPSCGSCNQSKSGTDWRTWMLGSALRSPKTRDVPDLQERVKRLEAFERWGDVQALSFREMIEQDEWDAYWNHLETIEAQMREAQAQADRIKIALQDALQ